MSQTDPETKTPKNFSITGPTRGGQRGRRLPSKRRRRHDGHETHMVPNFSFLVESPNQRPKFTSGNLDFFLEKEPPVQRSLSVLLPVKNAQATLAASVHETLDLLADSIERFELVIVDDGSTDATSEIAQELTSQYPQVRFLRHGVALGREAAIRTGLTRSRGEVVVMRDAGGSGFRILQRPTDLSRSRPSRPGRPNYLSRLRSFMFDE